MAKNLQSQIDSFYFRNLHPHIFLGTASDRYAAWIGQIYSDGKYKITKHSKKLGGKSFVEKILPVESVTEYFKHFPMLDLDTIDLIFAAVKTDVQVYNAINNRAGGNAPTIAREIALQFLKSN